MRNIESINSWYEGELALKGESPEEAEEWLPTDAELVGFIDRLVFILIHLNYGSSADPPDLVEEHWWRVFMNGYKLAAHLLANTKCRLRE